MRKLIFLLAAATVIAAAYIAEATPAGEATTSVAGEAPATLSLTLGDPASFGTFTPGVARDYVAGTTAVVTSTAGDALLSVHDASSIATGRLVNGAFSLAQRLQARARNAAQTGTAFNQVGSTASPLNLLTYSGPVSNDAVTLAFRQSIGANEALRTGTYAKQLTFTLSTTDGLCSLSLTLVVGSGPSSETANCGSPPDTVIAEATPAAEATTSVVGSVPATFSLTLGTPASFGAFTPCVTRTYLAGSSANLISTAGDATLTVHDASTVATGHLVNGAFSLPQSLQARASNAFSTGTAYSNIPGSASPLTLLTWNGPVSNDAVSLQFSQLINAVDALQSGTYAKELTFTLTSTDPPQSAVVLRLVITGSGPSAGTAICGPSSLGALTLQWVQASAKYQGSTAAKKNLITKTVNALVAATLNQIQPSTKPVVKAVLIAAYKLGVRALAAGGWLTTTQANQLSGFASAL